MLKFVFFKLTGFAITFLAAAAAIFLILNLLPGDPANIMLGLNAPPEAVEALRSELGLNQSLATRFAKWLTDLAQGNLGVSFSYRVPVATLVVERLAVTIPLALMSILLTLTLGLGLGVYTALHARRGGDLLLRFLALLVLSVPSFWAGLLLILLFAAHLHWFPSGGFSGWENGFYMGLRSLLLPALALSLAQSAVLLRLMRAALLDVLSETYIRTAHMKGLTKYKVFIRHAFVNACLPVLTLLGLQIMTLLTGSIVIENVFALPGLGQLLYQGVSQHDIPLVQNIVLIFVAAALAVQFIVNVTSHLLDPRLRLYKAKL